jgi:hypothetical protein
VLKANGRFPYWSSRLCRFPFHYCSLPFTLRNQLQFTYSVSRPIRDRELQTGKKMFMRHLRRLRTECAWRELWTIRKSYSARLASGLLIGFGTTHICKGTSILPKSLSLVTDTTYLDEKRARKDGLLKGRILNMCPCTNASYTALRILTQNSTVLLEKLIVSQVVK